MVSFDDPGLRALGDEAEGLGDLMPAVDQIPCEQKEILRGLITAPVEKLEEFLAAAVDVANDPDAGRLAKGFTEVNDFRPAMHRNDFQMVVFRRLGSLEVMEVIVEHLLMIGLGDVHGGMPVTVSEPLETGMGIGIEPEVTDVIARVTCREDVAQPLFPLVIDPIDENVLPLGDRCFEDANVSPTALVVLADTEDLREMFPGIGGFPRTLGPKKECQGLHREVLR
jgi:hypothetical protein